MNERDIAFINDNLLLEMASYWETKGGVVALKDSHQLINRFAEFKSLIMRGEFTLLQLSKNVFGTYGIMNGGIDNASMEKFLKDLGGLTDELAKKKNVNEEKK